MRWHPATGTGVIVLGNGTYAHAGQLALAIQSNVLAQLRAGAGQPGPAAGDGGPWPETLAARADADRLLHRWDEELAGRLLAPNVAWDQPLAIRREAITRVRERIGD